MSDEVKAGTAVKPDEPKKQRKPGRKPMSAEEKAAAAKERAAAKEKAEHLKPELFVQYQGAEIGIDALVEEAKVDFRAAKKRTPITDLKLYMKPEERMAYYVINGKFEGKISF